MGQAATYESDFYLWPQETAEKFWRGELRDIDLQAVAEEIDSLGRSDARQLENRTMVLLAHLLKNSLANEATTSWKLTIMEQRRRLEQVLRDSPSLNRRLPELLTEVYDQARAKALAEMKLSEKYMPATCPFTAEQVFGQNFFGP